MTTSRRSQIVSACIAIGATVLLPTFGLAGCLVIAASIVIPLGIAKAVFDWDRTRTDGGTMTQRQSVVYRLYVSALAMSLCFAVLVGVTALADGQSMIARSNVYEVDLHRAVATDRFLTNFIGSMWPLATILAIKVWLSWLTAPADGTSRTKSAS